MEVVTDLLEAPCSVLHPAGASRRLYGFGFRIGDIRGHRVVWHTGASRTLVLHLLEEPLTIIVLTNLSNTAGRHGTTLGRGIAGLLRPAYTPAALLAPQSDTSPALTQSLERLLWDVAQGHASPVMTAAHAVYYNALPPVARNPLREQLAGLATLRHIACDNVAGRGIRITDPISRICYHRAEAGERTRIFMFWLTADGRAAHLAITNEDDY